jgi:hypothetical protein
VDDIGDRLRSGVLVLVSGGGIGYDVPYVVQKRIPPPPELVTFFGTENIVVSSEEPVRAAVRRLGHPDDAAVELGLLGATVTIQAAANSSIAQALSGFVGSSLTMKNAHREGLSLFSRLAWTRAIGAFQIRYVDDFEELEEILEGSLGLISTIVPLSDTQERVQSVLNSGEEYDIIAAAEPGGLTTFVSDIALAFSDIGYIILTGQAVPPRHIVYLRGTIAEAARDGLDLEAVKPLEDIPEQAKPIIVGPPPMEIEERFIAHQWVSAQRKAAEALRENWPHGGPTLSSESESVGLIDVSTMNKEASTDVDYGDTPQVDGDKLKEIAQARGWHIIDPKKLPVLDNILREARRQISGDNTPIRASHLAQLKNWAGEPGFWARLPAATITTVEDMIIFPYPPTAVEIFRAIVAANGEAAELRRLLGPIKLAVLAPKPEKDTVDVGGNDDE